MYRAISRQIKIMKTTTINNHVQHEKKRACGENLRFFLLKTLKNCILNEKFNT